MGRNMQLKVIKADGKAEEYLHTKIIGTFNKVLTETGAADIFLAEHLAEVVTYFLYHKRVQSVITAGEILSMVKVALMATGYEEAAMALNDHHCQRKLNRCRVEVVSVDVCELVDAKLIYGPDEFGDRSRWNKSRIVDDLVLNYNLDYQTARTVAAMVEEKIFNMGITQVPISLIKQLVLADTAAVLQAERQLAAV